MNGKQVSKATLQRLPSYLTYLRTVPYRENISSAAIAGELGLGEIQVRKDLASVSSCGRPKTGYRTDKLIADLEEFLGYKNIDNAVVVGCGRLGMAILDYNGFSEYGMNIEAGFDADEDKVGVSQTGKEILPTEKLEEYCTKYDIKIGILCVPPECAFQACRMMVDAGIKAILNFAPVCPSAPEGIIVKNVNIAAQLAQLANSMANREYSEI